VTQMAPHNTSVRRTPFTKELLHFVDGAEVEIPLLRPKVAAALQLHGLSFKGGETSERLAITDRSRLQRWNAAVEATNPAQCRRAPWLLSLRETA
jgi:hypothetical protein